MNKTKVIYIYLKNNKIVYCIDDKFGNTCFKSIKAGKIINVEEFTIEFNKFIKSQGINNNIFGDTIYYLSINDSVLELSLIKDILHRFSFKNSIIVDVLDVLKDNPYIIVLKKNYILLNNGEKYVIPKIYNNILKDVLDNIEYQKIYMIGDIISIESLENIYTVYTPEDYLLTKFIDFVRV